MKKKSKVLHKTKSKVKPKVASPKVKPKVASPKVKPKVASPKVKPKVASPKKSKIVTLPKNMPPLNSLVAMPPEIFCKIWNELGYVKLSFIGQLSELGNSQLMNKIFYCTRKLYIDKCYTRKDYEILSNIHQVFELKFNDKGSCLAWLDFCIEKWGKSITSLDLSYQSITRLDRISANKFSEVPNSISKLTNLRKLDLQGNRLKNIPSFIGDFKKLEDLNLNKSEFDKLPNSLSQLSKLKVLDISGNQSQVLKLPDFHLPNLRELYCKSSFLKKIPNTIGDNFPKLQKLDLSFNQIKMLPNTIGQLICLKELDFCMNRLQELPNSIGNLINLQCLDISFNPLTTLPTSMGNLINLKYLNYENNFQLNDIPETIKKIPGLSKSKYKTGFKHEMRQSEVTESDRVLQYTAFSG